MKKINTKFNKLIVAIMFVMLLALVSIPFVCLSAQAQNDEISIHFVHSGFGKGQVLDASGYEVVDASVESGTTYTRSGELGCVLTLTEPSGNVIKFTAKGSEAIPGVRSKAYFDDYMYFDETQHAYKLPDSGTFNNNITISAEFDLATAEISYETIGNGSGHVENPGVFSLEIAQGTEYETTEDQIIFHLIDYQDDLILSAIAGKNSDFKGFFLRDKDKKWTIPVDASGVVNADMHIGFKFDVITADTKFSCNDEGHNTFRWTYTDPDGEFSSGEEVEFTDKLGIGVKYTMQEDGTIVFTYDYPQSTLYNDDSVDASKPKKSETETVTPVPRDGYKFKSFEINGENLEVGKQYSIESEDAITGHVSYEKLPPSEAASTKTGDMMLYLLLAILATSSLTASILYFKRRHQ